MPTPTVGAALVRTDATDVRAPDARPPRIERHSLGVEFRGIGRTFMTSGGPRVVLRDVSLAVAPGEVLAVIGASGGGKSTLLRAVAGLDMGFDGQLLIGGTPVRPYDPRTAMGFQEPRLLPWRSLRKNVELGLPRGMERTEGRERVERLLELVGLAAFADHRPREVSGGMAQRASLARALARRPGVLLLDEPFGALDALTRLKMQDLLLNVHAATGTTVLLVTHDVEEALQLADRVLLLSRPAPPAGSGTPPHGATIGRIVEVPDARPRDRADAGLTHLRSQLLAGLGVDAHTH